MRSGFGAAIIAIVMAWGAPAQAAGVAAPALAQTHDASAATELSARRAVRHHRRHPRSARRAAHPAYYARPTYYRPHGIAPFFPYGLGYGLEPSW